MLELPSGPATLETRVLLHLAAESHPPLRKLILDRCRVDYEFFIDYFIDTFDPRPRTGNDRPFLLYDFQRDALRTIHEHVEHPSDLVIEKSRDMGITWLILAYVFWRWLFDSGFSAHLGSLKESEVDNRSISSLFGKIDYMIRRLPGWMMPEGFREKRHRKKLHLEHPDPARNNLISGESSNPDFSRSGRHTMIVMDEGAGWDYFEEAWMAASQTSPCRIAISTPKGKNAFWRVVSSGKIDVLTLHWTLHPHKDQAWYDEQKSRMTDEEVAQELDISYERSASGVVYPGWLDVPKGNYPFEKGWPLWISIDFGLRDDTALVVWQRNPENQRFRAIDCYSNSGKPIDFYVPFLTGEINSEHQDWYTQSDLAWISERSLWGPAIIYGDPAGKQRAQTDGRSVIDVLRSEYGVNVVTNDYARDFPTRKRMTELGLRTLDVNLPACNRLDAAMQNARFPERRIDASASQNVRPLNDWTGHYRTAVEFFFVNVPMNQPARRPKPTVSKSRWWMRR